jgi:hypothetical protein
MKTVVAVFRPRTGEGRKGRAAGTNTEWLAMRPAEEPEVANRPMRFDFMASVWCGAMIGCIEAAAIPPFPESRSENLGFTTLVPGFRGRAGYHCAEMNRS